MEFNFTKSQLETLQKLVEYPDDFKYPVGTILASDDPDAIKDKGGLWEQIKDAFLWGSGDVKSITYLDENGVSVTKSLVPGATGGEINHKLAVAEMPSHNHIITFESESKQFAYNVTLGESGNTFKFSSKGNIGNRNGADGSHYTGGSQPHNNMPPYMAKYMWIKTKLQSELEGENV